VGHARWQGRLDAFRNSSRRQAYKTAVAADLPERAAEILAAAKNRWGTTNAFRFSPIAEWRDESVKNDAEQ
jgi:3'-phosphoadenosine 5'-phosphosulfate sulfotransferase (PAPS reductase)/FAD synthetase